MPRRTPFSGLESEEEMMRMRLGRKCWAKLAAFMVVGGTLLQTTTCNTTATDLGQQWLLSIVDIWITDYFNNQLNVTGSFF
jgi:hypothetical protein